MRSSAVRLCSYGAVLCAAGALLPDATACSGAWQYDHTELRTFTICTWDPFGGEDCTIGYYNVDVYRCVTLAAGGQPGGIGRGSTGGTLPPFRRSSPRDGNGDGKTDCWQDVVDSANISEEVLDENQRLGSDFLGPNRIRPWHTGIDLDCDEGDPVFATFEGVVMRSERDLDWGDVVKIQANGHGGFAAFAHLLARTVAFGDPVFPGTLIGYCDTTGSSSGGISYLHYEVACGNASNCFEDPESVHPCVPGGVPLESGGADTATE